MEGTEGPAYLINQPVAEPNFSPSNRALFSKKHYLLLWNLRLPAMQLRIDISWDHLIQIVQQLPLARKQQLLKSLQKELGQSPPQPNPLQDFLRNAPTWDEATVARVEEAHEELNQYRKHDSA